MPTLEERGRIKVVTYDCKDGPSEIEAFQERVRQDQPARIFVEKCIDTCPTDISYYLRPESTVVYSKNTWRPKGCPTTDEFLKRIKEQFPVLGLEGYISVVPRGKVYQVFGFRNTDEREYPFPNLEQRTLDFVTAVKELPHESTINVYFLERLLFAESEVGIIFAVQGMDTLATRLPKKKMAAALDHLSQYQPRDAAKTFQLTDLSTGKFLETYFGDFL